MPAPFGLLKENSGGTGAVDCRYCIYKTCHVHNAAIQEEYLTSVETSSRRSKRGHKTPEPQSPDVEAAKAKREVTREVFV